MPDSSTAWQKKVPLQQLCIRLLKSFLFIYLSAHIKSLQILHIHQNNCSGGLCLVDLSCVHSREKMAPKAEHNTLCNALICDVLQGVLTYTIYLDLKCVEL